MASKRRIRRKKCDGKVKYKSQDEANKAKGKIYFTLEHPVRAYRCSFCKYFHLGGYSEYKLMPLKKALT